MNRVPLVVAILFSLNVPSFADVDVLQERLQQFAVAKPSAVYPTVRESARQYIIGRQLASNHKHVDAVKHFKNSAELDPQSPAPWVGMAISLSALDQEETAKLVWEEVLLRDPHNPDALLILGIDAAKMGAVSRGQSMLATHWLQASPAPIESLMRLASMLSVFRADSVVHANLLDELDSVTQEAGLELRHAPSAAWLGLLQQLIDVGEYEVALTFIVDNLPNVSQKTRSALLTALPVIEAANSGDGSVTISEYASAAKEGTLTLTPRWSENTTLSEALSLSAQSMSIVNGDSEAPIRLYKESLQLNPNNALALNNLAWILMEEKGATLEVEDLCARAVAIDPNASYILDTAGRLQTILGNYPLALEMLTTAVERAEQASPEMYEHLGDVLWLLGEQDRAESMWNIALSIIQTEEFQKQRLELFASMSHSIWGIMVSTPEAMYDLEIYEVYQSLETKIAAVRQGVEPTLGLKELKHGVK